MYRFEFSPFLDVCLKYFKFSLPLYKYLNTVRYLRISTGKTLWFVDLFELLMVWLISFLHVTSFCLAGYGPILVFYMKKHGGHRRPRRETRCTEGGNNCCHKETLEINFRDIGWDYIMAPSSIRPNFCTGSCNG